MHENGYCLTCEADLEVSNVMDPSPCSTSLIEPSVLSDQPTVETSDLCPSVDPQPLPQIKSNDADATPRPDLSDHPLSQGNLMTLLQLHSRVKNFERVPKAMNILICDIREGTERELRRQRNEISVLFNATHMSDA